MKVVVFGGAGFVGSHVCDKLSDAGYEVYVFDIVDSPYLRSDQSMLKGDILDESAVNEAVQGSDAVFNLAGIADIGEANGRPVDTVKFNILGNTIVLEACRQAEVKRFANSSGSDPEIWQEKLGVRAVGRNMEEQHGTMILREPHSQYANSDISTYTGHSVSQHDNMLPWS